MQIGPRALPKPPSVQPDVRAATPPSITRPVDELLRLLVEDVKPSGDRTTPSEAGTDPRMNVVHAMSQLLHAIAPLLPLDDGSAAQAPHASGERTTMPVRAAAPHYTNGKLDTPSDERRSAAPPKKAVAAGAPAPRDGAPRVTTATAAPAPAPAPAAEPQLATAPAAAVETARGSARQNLAARVPAPTGEKLVDEPIHVRAGQVYEGHGMHFVAAKGRSDAAEGGPAPLFVMEPGAQLKNAQLSGGAGIHAQGDVTLKNVWWRDAAHGALTLDAAHAHVGVEGGGAFRAPGGVFELRGGGRVEVDGFTAQDFASLVRQHGQDAALDVRVSRSVLDAGGDRDTAAALVHADAAQPALEFADNQLPPPAAL